MRTMADWNFAHLLSQLLADKNPVLTRNHKCRRLLAPDRCVFTDTPIVTLRPTAWRKALRELEWFLSGHDKCPDELKDWWRGQLDSEGNYLWGYPYQLRRRGGHDQIEYLVDALIKHPYSRRHILTTWSPSEMAYITNANKNIATPSTCHLSYAQFFVVDGKLDMLSVQRSADVLLGLPHNWIQHWALLTWLARRTGLEVGRLIWQGGDVHLYEAESHIRCAEEIVINASSWLMQLEGGHRLVYAANDPREFRAVDFYMAWFGERPEPVSIIRPELL